MIAKATTTVGLILLAAISLVGVVVMVLTSKAVPPEMWLVTGTLVGGAAGVAIPTAPAVAPQAVPATVAQVAQQQPVA